MRGDQQKRGNRSLSLREKLDAILRVRGGESKASVARELGVPESTLRGWCKTEPKILRALQNSRRSSQSPDSSPYSPGTSSGGGTPSRLANGSNSSDDEAMPGPSGLCATSGPGTASKRRRTENGLDNGLDAASSAPGHDSTSAAAAAVAAAAAASSSPALDYLSVLGSSFLTNSMTDEQRTMLLQQSANVQLLASMYHSMYNSSRRNGATSLLGLSNGTGSNGAVNSTGAGSNSSTVNLVDNGLQYVRSAGQANGSLSNGTGVNSSGSNGSLSAASSRRSGSHSSVVAPASSFMDTIARSASRQSMSPAAEPPSTLIPSHHASDYYNGIAGLTNSHHGATNLSNGHARSSSGSANSASSTPGSGNNRDAASSRSSYRRRSSSSRFVLNENTRQAWMQASQQQNLDDSANGLSGNANFWKYYKTYGLPLTSSPAAAAPLTLQQQLQLRRSPTATATATSATESTSSSASTTAALNSATSTTSSLAPTNLCTRSPSEVRATLDSILFANGKDEKEKNGGSGSSSASSSSSNGPVAEGEDQQQPTANGNSENGEESASIAETTTLPAIDGAEALEHGERFLSWVEVNGDSGLTVLEVLQLRGMLNKVKDSRNPEKRAPKRSRK